MTEQQMITMFFFGNTPTTTKEEKEIVVYISCIGNLPVRHASRLLDLLYVCIQVFGTVLFSSSSNAPPYEQRIRKKRRLYANQPSKQTKTKRNEIGKYVTWKNMMVFCTHTHTH